MIGIFEKAKLQEKLARHEKRINDAIGFALFVTDRMQNGSPAEKAQYRDYRPLEYIKSVNLNVKAIAQTERHIKALKL